MEFVVVPDRKESKFMRFKRAVKAKLHNGLVWIVDNKEFVTVILLPITIGGLKLVTTVTKNTMRRINLNKEEAIKNLYVYDPSLGKYWRLKRELNNNEWLKIDQRRSKGERLSAILDDLGVLK